jgi:hypothetical protein
MALLSNFPISLLFHNQVFIRCVCVHINMYINLILSSDFSSLSHFCPVIPGLCQVLFPSHQRHLLVTLSSAYLSLIVSLGQSTALKLLSTIYFVSWDIFFLSFCDGMFLSFSFDPTSYSLSFANLIFWDQFFYFSILQYNSFSSFIPHCSGKTFQYSFWQYWGFELKA